MRMSKKDQEQDINNERRKFGKRIATAAIGVGFLGAGSKEVNANTIMTSSDFAREANIQMNPT